MDQEVGEYKKKRETEDITTVPDEEGGGAQNKQSPTKNMSPKKIKGMADDNDGGEEADETMRDDESTDDWCRCVAEEEKKNPIEGRRVSYCATKSTCPITTIRTNVKGIGHSARSATASV